MTIPLAVLRERLARGEIETEELGSILAMTR